MHVQVLLLASAVYLPAQDAVQLKTIALVHMPTAFVVGQGVQIDLFQLQLRETVLQHQGNHLIGKPLTAVILVADGDIQLGNMVDTVNIKQTSNELYIGDIVTGQDYITGNKVTKPIINKIVKRTNGVISRSYKIEGEK